MVINFTHGVRTSVKQNIAATLDVAWWVTKLGKVDLLTISLVKHFVIFHPVTGEVRSLYRAFKQECPNGIVDEDTFKEVYDKIFPLGDSSHYAHLVFAAIDRLVCSIRGNISITYIRHLK